MRKRIKELASGKFDYEKPEVSFSEETIEMEVLENQDYSGTFTMKSTNDRPIRGVIYSSNPRMECLTPQFDGREINIRYRFHGKGLDEGEQYEGQFTIVCNQVEYSLVFRAQISRSYPDSTMGKIKNLYDFCCLAKENWEEGYQLFYHKCFPNIIKPKEIKESMLYQGIIQSKPSNQNMEEFLVGIRKKNKINLSVDQTEMNFAYLTVPVKEKITIQKDSWGYVEFTASADGDFIVLEKKKFNTSDFLGSCCEFYYMIDTSMLHAGKNFGRIRFENAYQTIDVMILVEQKKEKDPESIRTQIKEYQVGMMELYQAYRLKQLVTGVWANETIEILNHLHALVPEEPMYLLMKAQAYMINRQRQDAEWILTEFKRQWQDRKSPVWGYYLYIMTLMEREPAYVDRMTREIELIFHENPDSVLLFWVLLFLKEEYFNNNAGKLKAIEYWVLKGCASPYLYIEAYYLISQDPYLLRKLDTFEIRILRWAIRRHVLTREIAEQIFQIAEMSREFSPVTYELMCGAYEVNPKPQYVGTICQYLIKGNRVAPKYHKWYEKGIELELRITSLYEAFLLSMDEQALTNVPKIIQMYFQYDSNLPYRKMAVLYNNIIAGKDTDPELYEQYRKAMSKFAMEQITLGHMDDNLAVIYSDMLELGFINQDVAYGLSKILFTHKLVVFGGKMVRALIYQRQLKEPQIVPIVDNVAYFQLFSKEYVILFEDAKGRRFAGSIPCQVQALMDASKYLSRCMELAPEKLSYMINRFGTKQNYLTFIPEDEPFFRNLIRHPMLSESYRGDMLPEIIHYYQNKGCAEEVAEYLQVVDFRYISSTARKYLLDLFVEHHLYPQACELISEYGIDQMGTAAKVNLSVFLLEKTEQQEDDFTTEIVIESFRDKKYNEVILDYLCKYYQGTTEEMILIWKAAENFEVDSKLLMERILSQALYTGNKDVILEKIFQKYYMQGGRELVVKAFLSVWAYDYFVDGKHLQEWMFEIIENLYLCREELNDACKLALLKHLSELSPTKSQLAIEDELLGEFTCRNMIFAFYKKLDKALIIKYHLYDKVIFEYHSRPGKHVVLHYSRDEDDSEFISEEMINVFGGIFVKQFVMFFGEMIQYYVSEESGGKVEVTESNRLTCNDIYSEKDESRYNLINQMLISNILHEDSIYQFMKRYKGLDEITRDVFEIL